MEGGKWKHKLLQQTLNQFCETWEKMMIMFEDCKEYSILVNMNSTNII